MKRFEDIRRLCCTAMLAAALTTCGSAVSAQIAVKFSLDSKFEGPVAPFLMAIDNGAFKAEGIDVSIDPAATAQEPISRVAAGTHAMGFADINALIRFRDANPSSPIKAVFMVYNKPAYSVVGRRSRGVTVPKDLEGRTLGAPAADPTSAAFRIFARIAGIDVAKVKIENVGIPVREPMLQNGQLDAVAGLSFVSYVNLKSMGVPMEDVVLMPMADHGVDLYGNAIIVNPQFAADHPEAVKGFLRALVKALKETNKDPASAVESVIKRNDVARKSVELERLRMVLRENIITPEVKANGYGAVDVDRLAKSIDQLALGHEFKNGKPKAADAFDPSFLPPAAQRKVH